MVNFNKREAGTGVIFAFDPIEGFLSAGASFSQIFNWKRLTGLLQ